MYRVLAQCTRTGYLEFMDALNHDAQVMTKHLTQSLVNLRRERPASQLLAKLTLDQVERGFDVGSLVVVL